ncbi:hypothetical protein HaLaN_21104 [Haematococcus lacustris]|uniref:Uncharacterized protein n=1 Tax=Haematococcus lacustris TaxID=44745 RepID=A0A699ZL34_HAELA|nr:hypothetical protein HaLaN_21104 [Haematococcus lacustris]
MGLTSRCEGPLWGEAQPGVVQALQVVVMSRRSSSCQSCWTAVWWKRATGLRLERRQCVASTGAPPQLGLGSSGPCPNTTTTQQGYSSRATMPQQCRSEGAENGERCTYSGHGPTSCLAGGPDLQP